MSCTSRLTQLLRHRGFRMTPQRLAILQALHDGGHLSPAQIFERVRQTGMTEATVYRTLNFLAENDILLVSNREKGHLTYELAEGSHHHLVCRSCGDQADIESGVLQPVFDQLRQRTGYSVDAGHFTFSGLCPACQPRG